MAKRKIQSISISEDVLQKLKYLSAKKNSSMSREVENSVIIAHSIEVMKEGEKEQNS